MRSTKVRIMAFVLLALVPVFSFGYKYCWNDGQLGFRIAQEQQIKMNKETKRSIIENFKSEEIMNKKKAYIAGGCFWGMEELFRNRPGILETEVGYIGGSNDNPTYSNHPGHAEGIEIVYDADKTNFIEILDYFFRIHNPSTVDQQGNDIGSSYRSAIFYQNAEEKKQSEDFIKIVNDSKRWPSQVVTTLEPYSTFWPAEAEHQDYLQLKPNGYTCHFERFDTPFEK